MADIAAPGPGPGPGPQPEPELLYAVDDGVGTITFNRPKARNALTWAMYDGLVRAVQQAEADPAVKALILTGAGEKAFAAGTDISQFRAFKTADDAIEYESRIDTVLGTLENCRKPVIAAIVGACTGGGAGIAACCDIRVASANTRFGFPIAKTLGNCLNIGNLARFTALIGPARVKELIFTARLFEAEEARSLGLISEVLPDGPATMARAMELARHVGTMAPLTLAATKKQLLSLRTRPEEDHGAILMCYQSADFREGMDAFLNKRAPVWQGR